MNVPLRGRDGPLGSYSHLAPRDGPTTNSGSILQLVTWLLLAITSLMFGFRLLTRFFIRAGKPFAFEDILISSSFIFGVGEYSTVLVPQAAVFGNDKSRFSSDTLESGLKAEYAGNLLFVLAVGLSKLCVTQSFLSLSPQRRHRYITFAIIATILLWMTSSLLGTAFQCDINAPWRFHGGSRCIDVTALLRYEYILSAITDLALVAVPILIVFPLRMPLKHRLTIISFYASRVIVVAITFLQLAFISNLFDADFTLTAFPYYITLQFIQFGSIISACGVYFWPFYQSVQSGLLGAQTTAVARSEHTRSGLGGSSYELRGTGGSRGRQKGYIEITTEVSVASARGGQQGKDQGGGPEGKGGGPWERSASSPLPSTEFSIGR